MVFCKPLAKAEPIKNMTSAIPKALTVPWNKALIKNAGHYEVLGGTQLDVLVLALALALSLTLELALPLVVAFVAALAVALVVA